MSYQNISSTSHILDPLKLIFQNEGYFPKVCQEVAQMAKELSPARAPLCAKMQRYPSALIVTLAPRPPLHEAGALRTSPDLPFLQGWLPGRERGTGEF